MPDIRPTNPHKTSTSADNPSTRSESPNAAGMTPPRNCPAVATQSTNVSARPPIMVTSLSRRGPPTLPTAAVTRGTTSVQNRKYTLPFQLGKTADVHRFEPPDDAADENAEHQHGQHHVERDPELDDERHPGGHADRGEKHRVLDRQERQDLRDGLLARHHQEEADQQHREGDADEVMAHALRALGEAGAHAIADDGQSQAHEQRR